MAESLGKAVLELDADAGPLDAALAQMNAATSGQFSALGTKLSQIMGGNVKAGMVVAGAAVIAGAAVAGAALYKLGGTFDDAYDKIITKTGATGDELEGLKDDFKDVFSSVPTDAESAATAIGELNQRLGLTGDPLREVSKQVLELSRLTGTDLSGNIESVSKAFVDWEVPTDKMASTLDGFFAISQDTGISVADLASSVQKFGSPLRQLGFSLEESAAMFGVFEKAGVNTQTMVPGFKMALKNLIQPSGALKDKLHDLGITAKEPGDALRQVMKVMTDESIPAAERTGLAMDVFGSRAGADMKEAIEQGRFSLEGMIDTFKNGKGSISEASENTRDLSESWQVFKNQIAVKLEPIAVGVFDAVNAALIWMIENSAALKPVLYGLIGLLGLFAAAAVVSATTMTAAWLMAQGAAVAAGVRHAITFGIMLAGWVAGAAAAVANAAIIVGAWLAMQVAAIAAAVAASAAWIIATGGLILVVAAVVAAVALIITNWETLKGYLVKYWPYILTAIAGPIGAILALIITHWDRITATITAAWNAVKSSTTSAWNAVKSFITGAVSAIVSFIGTLPGKAAAALSSLGSKITSVASSAWNSFRKAVDSGIDDAVSLAKSVPGKIVGALGNVGSLLYNAGVSIANSLKDGLLSGLQAVYNEVKKVAAKIKSLKGPIQYDRKLLIPEGKAIISGLQAGMDTQLTGLYENVGGIAPAIKSATPASAAAAPTMPGMDRLVNAIDALNQSGTAGAIDALADAVNERIGNVGVGGRRLTAGDGRISLP